MKTLAASIVLLAVSTTQAGQNPVVNQAGEVHTFFRVDRCTAKGHVEDAPEPSKEVYIWPDEIRERVTKAQKLFRSPPPEGSDQIESGEHETQTKRSILKLVTELSEKPIAAPFKIVDIIERKPPRPPAPPAVVQTEAGQRLYEAKAYRQKLERFKAEQYCVVGVMSWQQPVVDMPRDHRQWLATLRRKARADRVRAWRDCVPTHHVVFRTDQSHVSKWRVGQIREVIGRMRLARLVFDQPKKKRIYAAGREYAYAQLDILIVPDGFELPREAAASDKASDQG